MANASETILCAFKYCTDDSDLQNESRVEVKSFAPGEKVSSFSIAWESDGQASFHRQCWHQVKGNYKTVTANDQEKEMIKEASKTAEYFDSPSDLEREAQKTADFLRDATHAIAFTGAGISTSAGIGDFRGKGGAWTERDRKKKYGTAAKSSNNRRSFTYEGLRPTYTHEAIAKLVEMGLLKYVVSQNCDGLHRLSGVPADKISEMHGNVFHEKCENCEKRYERKFSYRSGPQKPGAQPVPPKPCPTCRINHRTGGVCEDKKCGGYLMNTIINFGDSLEEQVLDSAIDNAKANDMVLCLGSSLTVTPACNLVEMGDPVRMSICNRQPTPFDYKSKSNGSRFYGDCDDLMSLVMKNLLSPEDLQEWEEGRDKRLKEYASQRA